MKFYINKLKSKQNFKNIPGFKIVLKNMFSIINLTIETIYRIGPLLSFG